MPLFTRQKRAITGRRGYNPTGISSSPPFYPKQTETEIIEETPERQYEYGPSYNSRTLNPDLDRGYYGGINRNDMMAAQEEGYYENIEREKRGEEPLTEMEIHQNYIDKFRIPDDTLSGLRRERNANLPAGNNDISAGLPEGFSDVSGFAPVSQANQTGLAIQEGDVKGAISHGLQGLVASTPIGMLGSVTQSILGPPISKGYQAVKGALGFGDPDNLGSAVGSGVGISGLSGPMGLSAMDTGMNDLADLDIGDFGGGDDGMGGMGGLGDSGASVGGGMGDF